MRVGLYIDTYYPVVDGVVNVAKNTARWINKKYGTCYIASPNYPGYVDTDDIEVRRFFSLPIGYPPYRFGLPTMDLSFQKAQLKEYPDIIHAHSPFSAGRYAQSFARDKKIPFVASFHSKYYDDFLENTKSTVIAKQLLRYTMKFYASVDYVWTVNHSTAQTMREYGYEGDVDVVPNGVDFVFPKHPQSMIKRAKQILRLGDEHVFLFVGQHVEQKNPRMLLKAMALYKKTGANFKLLMAGDGIAREKLTELAFELGLESNVIFLGRIMDRRRLQALYLTCDVFTFPSLYDNAPLVVREAAAMARPSLLIEGSNAAEGVTDGENGYLCKATPESICAKLSEIMSSPENRLRAGEEAQRTIAIAWEAAVDFIVKRYEEVIEDYHSAGTLGGAKGIEQGPFRI